MVRRVVFYSGRVQGVGFRATAAGYARGLAVTGWVRNEPDGTVRMEAQGDPKEVDELLGRLRRAMGGHIRSEHAHDAPPLPGEDAFGIER